MTETIQNIEEQIRQLQEAKEDIERREKEERERDLRKKALAQNIDHHVTVGTPAVLAEQAANLLDMLGARFKIITPDGTQYTHTKRSQNKVSEKPTAGAALKYGRGVVSKWIMDELKYLKPGYAKKLLPNKYDLDALKDSTSRTCAKMWGAGTYTTKSTSSGVIVRRKGGGL